MQVTRPHTGRLSKSQRLCCVDVSPVDPRQTTIYKEPGIRSVELVLVELAPLVTSYTGCPGFILVCCFPFSGVIFGGINQKSPEKSACHCHSSCLIDISVEKGSKVPLFDARTLHQSSPFDRGFKWRFTGPEIYF